MRASDLTTKSQTAVALARSGSGRSILAALTVAMIVRAMLGPPDWYDLLIVGASVPAVGFVEWVIHRFLLHAPPDSATTRLLGTGRGHYEHHRDPTHLGWLLLGGTEAAVFSVLIALGSLIWVGTLALLVPGMGWATIGTATVFALGSLAHYEYVHLLVHTRYRPRSRYYRRLARNHRLHHFRNERHWLGVTSNLGDRALGTYPDRSEVPLSETARDLSKTATG